MTRLLSVAAQLPGNDALGAGEWLVDLLSGPFATALAVIAVGWFGLTMLSGQTSLRRGALLVTGCFILFAAPGMAQALLGLAQRSGGGVERAPPLIITVPPPPRPVAPTPFDPYAGASVPQN